MADQPRLFFALWPDDELRRQITRLVDGLPEHGGRVHHPDDFHATLVFLGVIDPERLPCVEQAADTVRVEPFSMQLDQIGYWPRPRIPWVGPSETPEALTQLVRDLQQQLQACGFKPERRPYKPHITLARKARRIASSILDEPLGWKVKEFVLAGSNLGERPPRYQVLNRWALGLP